MASPREILEQIRRDFFAGQEGALDSDAAVEAFGSTIAKVATDDFACIMDGGALTTRYEGIEGVRAGWRDFLAAFEAIRIVPGEVIETDDGLLEYVHLVGRPVGIEAEIQQEGAAVWRLRGDRLALVEFHTDRERARASAGVSG